MLETAGWSQGSCWHIILLGLETAGVEQQMVETGWGPQSVGLHCTLLEECKASGGAAHSVPLFDGGKVKVAAGSATVDRVQLTGRWRVSCPELWGLRSHTHTHAHTTSAQVQSTAKSPSGSPLRMPPP